MKIQNFLKKAKKCTSDKQAEAVLREMQDAFKAKGVLSESFYIYNAEAWVDLKSDVDKTPFIRFDLIKEINDGYMAVIKPQINCGNFSMIIQLVKANDNLGVHSRDVDEIEDTEIEAGNISTVSEMATLAVNRLIYNHTNLLESVGVPSHMAQSVARVIYD